MFPTDLIKIATFLLLIAIFVLCVIWIVQLRKKHNHAFSSKCSKGPHRRVAQDLSIDPGDSVSGLAKFIPPSLSSSSSDIVPLTSIQNAPRIEPITDKPSTDQLALRSYADRIVHPSSFHHNERAMVHSHAGPVAPSSFIILFKDVVANVSGVSDSISDLLETIKVTHQFEHCIRGISACHLTQTMVESLRHHPVVDGIYEDGIIQISPFNEATVSSGIVDTPVIFNQNKTVTTADIPWGIKRIGGSDSSLKIGGSLLGFQATPAWPVRGKVADEKGSTMDVDIFILDTGIDPTHPDLNVGSLGKNFVLNEMKFVTTEQRENAIQDLNGHGTHVAGIAAAKDHGYGCVGSCPGARVHAIRVLDVNGAGQFSFVIAGVNYLQGLKQASPDKKMVANISLGTPIGSSNYNVLDIAVSQAISSGITFCVSAGNAGQNASTFSPAHVSTAITIGSYSETNTITPFSNFGPAVTVLAPGTNILSTYIEGKYAYLSGTSMSTPFATGVAALYLNQNPLAKPAAIKCALVQAATASSLPADDAAAQSPKNPLITNVPTGTTNFSLWMGNL